MSAFPTITSGQFAGLPDLNAIYPNGPTGQSTLQIQGGLPSTGVSSDLQLPTTILQPPSVLDAPISAPQNPNNLLGNVFNALNNIIAPGSSPSSSITSPSNSGGGLFGNTFSGLSWGRVGAFILGLILIAGGIFLFGKQPASEAVSDFVRSGTAV